MFERLRKFFKSKQKGQSVIVFAASVPILCAFMGMAMDFGWMYLNQSRLQNAADAAALAGSAYLIGKTKDATDVPELSGYTYNYLVSNNDTGFQTLLASNSLSKLSTASGDKKAKKYAEEYNLQTWLGSDKTQLVTSDAIGKDANGNENIKFETAFYGPYTDLNKSYYYTVTLTTELEHIFGSIIEYFGIGKLNAKAMATVKITRTYSGKSLYEQMKEKELKETFATWEDIVVEQGSAGAANNRSVLTGGASYTSGNLNRTEVSLLNGNAFKSGKGNPAQTGATGAQTSYDDIFIDFQGEIRGLGNNTDTDLSVSNTSGSWDYGDTLTGNLQYSYRVHFPICVNLAYPVRSSPPDSLYAFIEQEPIINTSVIRSDGSTYSRSNMSSVRQIIISVNTPNTNANSERPIVFFYEGPEIPYSPNSKSDDWDNTYPDITEAEAKKLHSAHSTLYDEDGDYIGGRPFLPVILNLHADFRGVIFAPSNPVVINGNGHKMEGFVVGKTFKRLKKSSDFSSSFYTSGSDQNKPQYISFTYDGGKGYAEVENWKELTSTNISGYVETKVNFNGTWVDGYVKNKEWYSRSSNPDVAQYVQISDGSNGARYSFFKHVLLKTKLSDNKTYVATYTGKFYIPVKAETVSYLTDVDSSGTSHYFYDTITHSLVYSSSGTKITQNLNPIVYISGTPYTYTETFVGNVSGKTKTKQSTMAVGDVQFMEISTVTAAVDSETGQYSEMPDDTKTFKDDDSLRYDYENIFNLNVNSTYNSFLNVELINYSYLAKNETSANTSHDMFFTTVRSKHID